MGKATDFLGAFQPTPPMDVNGKKQFLDSLKKNEPSRYDAIRKAMNEYHDFINKDESQKDCVQTQIGDPANLTDDESRWVGYFITNQLMTWIPHTQPA